MILYYTPGACSLAVHIALEEVGARFETCTVDLVKGEQRDAAYRAINPVGRVPALVVEHQVLTEVPALLTFAASLDPDCGLLPRPATLAYARCFEWLGFLSSTAHVAYAQFRRPERFVPPDLPVAGDVVRHGLDKAVAAWREIESRLTGRDWAAGDSFTIADAYLLPLFTWSWRLELDGQCDLPNWAAIMRKVADRPAVRRVLEREGVELALAA